MDPGLATTGYGIIEVDETDNNPVMMSCGVIKTPPETEFCQRLKIIYQSVNRLIEKFEPDAIAVEKLYFSKNIKTAFPVAQARGVILLAASNSGVTVDEYSPLQIKKTITGSGKADKKAMQKMVTEELELPGIPKPDDAADGLAIAICHVILNRFNARLPDD
ncbi:MAG: crossover junction endodeoxyribonuclease RuvC [bacterium]